MVEKVGACSTFETTVTIKCTIKCTERGMYSTLTQRPCVEQGCVSCVYGLVRMKHFVCNDDDCLTHRQLLQSDALHTIAFLNHNCVFTFCDITAIPV